MLNLDQLRKIKHDSYETVDECRKNARQYGLKFQTNPKFNSPVYDQTYFTCGDHDDLEKHILLHTRVEFGRVKRSKAVVAASVTSPSASVTSPAASVTTSPPPTINYCSIRNTLLYMFERFKKGIFVSIKRGQIAAYIPFNNAEYRNNWHDRVFFSSADRADHTSNPHSERRKHIDNFSRKHPHNRGIEYDRSRWYANNCTFRAERDSYVGELNTTSTKYILEQLVKKRTIPDVEFFINDRDHPILRPDPKSPDQLCEPYEHIFDSETVPIENGPRLSEMCPIFSKSITKSHADRMFPTYDDIALASNRFFTGECSTAYSRSEWKQLNLDWDSKKPICVWRGSATGCGIHIKDNVRLRAADLSVDHPDLLDVRITNWNSRMKKSVGTDISVIDPSKFRFGLEKTKMTNVQKSQYKYILYMEGHVAAFRLGPELSMGSVILIVESEYRLHYSDKLVPYEHYVPVKKDLSDLVSQIEWCRSNDHKCRKIASNALKLHSKILSMDAILDYLANQMNELAQMRQTDNLLAIRNRVLSPTAVRNRVLSPNGVTLPRVALITIFRDAARPIGTGDRTKQLETFLRVMPSLLNPYCRYRIFVIEQSDDGDKFNIGKLKNVGFKIARDWEKRHSEFGKFDKYVFSDVDMLPDYELTPYYVGSESPITLAYRGTRYEALDKRTSKIFLGGVLGFTAEDFENINGYPNNFWGWGGEDDALANRMVRVGLTTVYYPKVGRVIDIETSNLRPITIKEKLANETIDSLKWEKLYNDVDGSVRNGLNSLNYNLLNKTRIDKRATQYLVDLRKADDDTANPYVAPTNFDWKKDRQLVTDRYAKLTKQPV